MPEPSTEDRIRAVIRDELADLGLIERPEAPGSLVDRLRLARKEAGLTQYEVADLWGVTQGTVAATERGGRRLLPRQLEQMAAALGKRIVLVDLPKEIP